MEPRYAAAAVLGMLLLGWSVVSSGSHGGLETLRRPAGADGPVALLWGKPLDLHRASAADLEVLPGVGPVRARAIVRARCERPFGSLADLERVPGIGPRTVERLDGWVRLRDPLPHGCDPGGSAPPDTPGLASAAGRPEGT